MDFHVDDFGEGGLGEVEVEGDDAEGFDLDSAVGCCCCMTARSSAKRGLCW